MTGTGASRRAALVARFRARLMVEVEAERRAVDARIAASRREFDQMMDGLRRELEQDGQELRRLRAIRAFRLDVASAPDRHHLN